MGNELIFLMNKNQRAEAQDVWRHNNLIAERPRRKCYSLYESPCFDFQVANGLTLR